jgi:hypothetical protein
LLHEGMQLAQPYADCSIVQEGRYLRANVGYGRRDEVLECYRTIAVLALQHKFTRVLVVGKASGDAVSQLAARDAVIALADFGVPAGFRIAFVALTHETLNAYLHAEIAATDRGIRAKVFRGEEEALRWITEPDQH